MAYESMEVLELFDEFETKLNKSYNNLKDEFMTLKVGRANAHVLDKVMVDAYGASTPINQVGNISIPEARMLVISVWDKSLLKNVEKAILAANIGLTPMNDGNCIRLIFPELTQDRRKEFCKTIKATGENSKVVMRNARRDINDGIKKLKKDSIISEDEEAVYSKDIDKKLAEYIESVDKAVSDKEKEVMSF